jgi:hypothetical protein
VRGTGQQRGPLQDGLEQLFLVRRSIKPRGFVEGGEFVLAADGGDVRPQAGELTLQLRQPCGRGLCF